MLSDLPRVPQQAEAGLRAPLYRLLLWKVEGLLHLGSPSLSGALIEPCGSLGNRAACPLGSAALNLRLLQF